MLNYNSSVNCIIYNRNVVFIFDMLDKLFETNKDETNAGESDRTDKRIQSIADQVLVHHQRQHQAEDRRAD